MTIKKNTQIIKFGLYGLLKNLKFFEPFLWLYFLVNGLSLLEIGALYAIRETIVYIFEIPSGVLADRFGRKNELVLCFIFYIFSFVMFFFSNNFGLFIIAISLYGLGEAFRSGTHKAMIMQYLDENDLKESKSQVYGLTRSYSNVGSAISSITGIALVVFTPNLSYLFLIAIIPYIFDLGLILSYPKSLNKKLETEFKFTSFIKESISSVKYALTTRKLNAVILNSSSYNAIFKTIKDYIQPIFVGLGITLLLFSNFTIDENTKIYIGLIYFTAHFVNIFVTKNAYLLQKLFTKGSITSMMWILTGITCIVLGLFMDNLFIVVFAFILFYVYLNVRKPYMVELIGNSTVNDKRASVLSIESQLTSLMIIILAPLAGFLSDYYGIHVMMISLGIFMLLIEIVYQKQKSA
ncbi:Major Facilitator Superfamily protein [Candidatus Izimaplasma bacterium HR1]|jgi:MFS family permease|uniref:MFS transporter n=1 Tax=Candidatus Izimoplasma sp. HR1 TaxID=1541959 RepID=UPI0004F8DDD4|nr:Major Facilitator Superfamily protein [Candidatus Izimaplasma bacterium HR1]